jgi:catechol 2,3-dioxygenase-like lactoylglutathione lyase family enzyme
MVPTKLDHCVIHVTDWERSDAFYTQVLGAELVTRPAGFAYRFGDKQLNVHGPGVKPAEVARLPVAPGNSDLCFEWVGPIADAVAHLERCEVPIEAGPMQRFGARGPGTSVLFPRSRRIADGVHVLQRVIPKALRTIIRQTGGQP